MPEPAEATVTTAAGVAGGAVQPLSVPTGSTANVTFVRADQRGMGDRCERARDARKCPAGPGDQLRVYARNRPPGPAGHDSNGGGVPVHPFTESALGIAPRDPVLLVGRQRPA